MATICKLIYHCIPYIIPIIQHFQCSYKLWIDRWELILGIFENEIYFLILVYPNKVDWQYRWRWLRSIWPLSFQASPLIRSANPGSPQLWRPARCAQLTWAPYKLPRTPLLGHSLFSFAPLHSVTAQSSFALCTWALGSDDWNSP